MTDKEWIDSIKNVPTEELFEKLEYFGCDGYFYTLWCAIIEELKNRVRSQGEWKANKHNDHYCSECGTYADEVESQDGSYYEDLSRFCPACGADMRVKNELKRVKTS